MATGKKKAFNGISGRVGNTVIYERNGVMVQREIGISNKPATKPQKNQRTKFVVYNEFRGPLQELILIGFAAAAKKLRKTANDLFSSHILNDCIIGDKPNQQIDYPKVLFSRGTMPQTQNIRVLETDDGLTFTWDTQLVSNKLRSDDQVMVLVYFPELRKAQFEVNAAKRGAGELQLKVLRNPVPTVMETYLSFKSEGSTANSTYTGRLILPAIENRRSRKAITNLKQQENGTA